MYIWQVRTMRNLLTQLVPAIFLYVLRKYYRDIVRWSIKFMDERVVVLIKRQQLALPLLVVQCYRLGCLSNLHML
jgi:hypothetical protein